MLIDITLKVTAALSKEAQGNQDRSLVGHLGTHFDVMNKEFPLEYTRRKGIVFDVSSIHDRDIGSGDIDLSLIGEGMFAAFYTGYLEEVGYGNRVYFGQHPQLTDELIDALLDKGVSIIAVDCAGVRRGKEHTPKDQYCADRGCFVIENLCNLEQITTDSCMVCALPLKWRGADGAPARVVAML